MSLSMLVLYEKIIMVMTVVSHLHLYEVLTVTVTIPHVRMMQALTAIYMWMSV